MAESTKRKESSMISITHQYVFQRDANIWTNVYQFEQDLADFFAKNGLEATVITTVDGSTGGRMMFIRKIPETSVGTLDNMKGVNLKNQKASRSGRLASGLTGQLNKSYIKQFPGGKK